MLLWLLQVSKVFLKIELQLLESNNTFYSIFFKYVQVVFKYALSFKYKIIHLSNSILYDISTIYLKIDERRLPLLFFNQIITFNNLYKSNKRRSYDTLIMHNNTYFVLFFNFINCSENNHNTPSEYLTNEWLMNCTNYTCTKCS